MNVEQKQSFHYGFKKGLPIAFGYVPVSFTFGLTAVSGGIPIWLAIMISLTNLTSAGQFAGTNLIIQGAGFMEITLTTFIINIRYMLMSLSLSQKVEKQITVRQRLCFAFGITDETFSMASMEPGKLSNEFMLGLISAPILGWTLGTAAGALVCSALPQQIASAMGIALYGMFIAIIIPPAKKSKKVILVLAISISITCLLKYIPFFSFISSGFRIIIATMTAAGICAAVYPIEDEMKTAGREDRISDNDVCQSTVKTQGTDNVPTHVSAKEEQI